MNNKLANLNLCKNNGLIILPLESNKIGDEGACAIGEALKVNKTLTNLNISKNNGLAIHYP